MYVCQHSTEVLAEVALVCVYARSGPGRANRE